MNKKLTMKEVMTPHPHTIGVDQPLEHAKKQMYSSGIRHLPVLDGGHCVGMLSDRDIKLAYAVEQTRAATLKVGDACSSQPFAVAPTDSLKDVAEHMAREGLGSAVVIEREKVIGIFTTTDACRVIAEKLLY